MKFNLDDYPIGSKVAMHCPTEEEANKFLAFLEEKCVTWADGTRLTRRNYYDDLGEDICYSFTDERNGIRRVKYDSISYYKRHKYTILEFGDFSFGEGEEFVPNELTAFLIGIMTA